MDDPQALAEAETYLIHVLETSDPPRDSNRFHITQAAQEYHATTGTWDLRSVGPHEVEELLARHAK